MALLPADAIYLADFCQYWLDTVKQGKSILAPKTYAGYKSAIDKWIRPYLGQVKLINVSRKHIMELFAEVTRKGQSKSVQNQLRAVLKPALEEAELENYIPSSPFKKIPMMKKKSGSPKFLTLREVHSVLDVATAQGSELLWHLYLIYGPRQGECLGLRWCDIQIDDENRFLVITRQLQRITGKGLCAVPLKTVNSYRTIALTDKTRDMFHAAREAHKTAQMVNGPSWNPEGYVFVTPNGTPLDPANNRKAWVKLLSDAGVDFKPLHAARHTAGTYAANLNVASKLLGHSSIRVTADFYAGIPLDDMRASVEALERRIHS